MTAQVIWDVDFVGRRRTRVPEVSECARRDAGASPLPAGMGEESLLIDDGMNARIDLAYLIEHRERVEGAWRKTCEIVEYLRAMHVDARDPDVLKRMQGIRNSLLKNLCTQIGDSSDWDWTGNPPHWCAVALVFSTRLHAAMQLARHEQEGTRP